MGEKSNFIGQARNSKSEKGAGCSQIEKYFLLGNKMKLFRDQSALAALWRISCKHLKLKMKITFFSSHERYDNHFICANVIFYFLLSLISQTVEGRPLHLPATGKGDPKGNKRLELDINL